MPGRSFSSGEYRYGYQSSEKDGEIIGTGNSYTTKFRQLDPRLGRWWSIDPKSTSAQSPYMAMDGNPIANNDRNGDCTICDELERAKIITHRAWPEGDLINVRKSTSITNSKYSHSPSTGSGANWFRTIVGNGEFPAVIVDEVTETTVSSSVTFTNNMKEVKIKRVTATTVVKLSDQGVKSINVTTNTQSVVLGVSESGIQNQLLSIDVEVPLVDVVNSRETKGSLSYNSISSGLKTEVKRIQEYNQKTLKQYSTDVYDGQLQDNIRKTFESATDVGDETPNKP